MFTDQDKINPISRLQSKAGSQVGIGYEKKRRASAHNSQMRKARVKLKL